MRDRIARPHVVSPDRVVQRQAWATVGRSTGQYGPPRDSRGDRISHPSGGRAIERQPAAVLFNARAPG